MNADNFRGYLCRLIRFFSLQVSGGGPCLPRKKRAGATMAALLVISALSPALGAPAQPAEPAGDDTELISKMNIEDLMHVVVSSAAKKEQPLSNAACAIYVITGEDIRNSGVTSIPEALRMAPGLHVARIDAHSWAITSRGFNGLYANKLLVLMDGRSIYSPLSAGINWDEQDTILDDIERIEVIRGPGASLWGANAVNGVINIITKDSADTTGVLATAGGGTQEKGFGALRYGTGIGQDANLRIYGKYLNRNSLATTGNDVSNGWDVLRGGGRFDWRPNLQDSLTLQGDLYNGKEGVEVLTPIAAGTAVGSSGQAPGGTASLSTTARQKGFSGANAIAKFQRGIADDSDLLLQLYYDKASRSNFSSDERRTTVDIDLQYRFRPWQRHELTLGAGYRLYHNNFASSVDGSTGSNDYRLANALLQDDITLFTDKLHLIVGSKLEHNDYTGIEVQPNVRMLWTPNQEQSFWASVARAVRTPSLQEAALTVQIGQNTVALGTTSFKSEDLLAYELGYRAALSKTSSLDISVFYNNYSKLSVTKSVTDQASGLSQQSSFNGMDAQSYGAELVAEWRPASWYTLTGNYTFISIDAQSSTNSTAAAALKSGSPRHQASLRSMIDMGQGVALNFWGRFVDKISSTSSTTGATTSIPAYATMDGALVWKPVAGLELALVGQNLVQARHKEFQSETGSTLFEVGRSFYGKATWQF
jgi:iron complex outermembrane recepter protein